MVKLWYFAIIKLLAKMMELVDMLGLGSGVLYNELKGSTPFFGK